MLTPTKSDTVAHTATRLPKSAEGPDEERGGGTGTEGRLACGYCDWSAGCAIGMGCECDAMMDVWPMRVVWGCGGSSTGEETSYSFEQGHDIYIAAP